MRRLLIALAITLLPSFAIAHGHGGGGHMSGGHVSSGHMSSWSGHASAAMAGGRMSGWNGSGVNWSHAAFHHGRFAHRHNRFFVARGPFFAGYGFYGYDCWRWAPTPRGPRRVWVCGDYY